MPKKDFNRILIKLSGESLMGKEKYGIELKTVERLASDLINLKKLNIQICIVIGQLKLCEPRNWNPRLNSFRIS